jgi:hypothetical protein
MGIKIVLTEEQAERLEAKVGKLPITEANMACTDLNYDSLNRFVGGKEMKKLGNNTIVHKIDEKTIGVKYHRTDIIKIDQDNTVILNTNGWETTTTKDRLNQFLRCRGYHIFQKKGIWYLSGKEDTFKYEDGVRITSNGDVIRASANAIKNNILNLIKNKEIDPKYSELYGLSNNDN